MNFLGIGFGELFLIMIVLLVVVGPERLPELARQAGRLVVRARTWIQSSPDAALVMRARQEIEQELATLKSSLLEVQSVRDEVMDAARQLNDSVSPIAAGRLNMDDLLGTPPIVEHVVTANGQLTSSVPLEEPLASTGVTVPAGAPVHLPAQPDVHEPLDVTVSELEQLNFKIQVMMSDLWALQEQLKQRGLLDQDWSPPSYAMQLPDPPLESPQVQPEEVSS